MCADSANVFSFSSPLTAMHGKRIGEVSRKSPWPVEAPRTTVLVERAVESLRQMDLHLTKIKTPLS